MLSSNNWVTYFSNREITPDYGAVFISCKRHVFLTMLLNKVIFVLLRIRPTSQKWLNQHLKLITMQGKTLGIIVIVIGIIMVAYTGFDFETTEKVVDIGPIEINKEKNHSVQWPPVVGILLVVAGVVMLVRGRKA